MAVSNATRTLADVIRREIYADMLKRGQRLPSPVELAKAYSVSAGTVQGALRILTDEGTVIRRGPYHHVRDKQSLTPAVLRRLLVEASELLDAAQARGTTKAEVRLAVTAWRTRAREAGADV